MTPRNPEQTKRSNDTISRAFTNAISNAANYLVAEEVIDMMIERGPTNLTVWVDHERLNALVTDLQRAWATYVVTGEDPKANLHTLIERYPRADLQRLVHRIEWCQKS